MPNYRFSCTACGHEYHDLCPRYDETGEYPDVACPACASTEKTQGLTACQFAFAQPEGTSRFISNSTGHDYRFKDKMNKEVIPQRIAAENKSHMGGTDEIYRKIDDLNKDSSWGEVK